MSDITKDALLNARLRHNRSDRQFITEDTTRWGELILPGPDENPDKRDGGMRMIAVTSFLFGYLVLETIKAYERRFPKRLDLVGVITDDPVNSDAKIGMGKRFWKFFDPDHRLDIETATVEAGLSFGVPVYTGEVKNDWFRAHARDWRPDVIFCSGFGQLMGPVLLGLPPMGVYNFHPSDLSHGHGAGFAPYDDVKARDATTSCWTVHLMSEVIDEGPIVGSSPPILVRDEGGALADHPIQHYNKMMDGLDHLVATTLDALTRTHASGDSRSVEDVDFEALLSPEVRQRMMEPIRDKRLRIPLPIPDSSLFA